MRASRESPRSIRHAKQPYAGYRTCRNAMSFDARKPSTVASSQVPSQRRIDDLLRGRIRADHELLAQIIRRSACLRQLGASRGFHPGCASTKIGRTLLRTRFAERREAGEDQRFAGSGAAHDVATGLSPFAMTSFTGCRVVDSSERTRCRKLSESLRWCGGGRAMLSCTRNTR